MASHLFLASCLLLAQVVDSVPATSEPEGSFQQLLDVVGISEAQLTAISSDNLNDANWDVVAQLISRLKQSPEGDLDRWTRSSTNDFTSESVGDLFDVRGVAVEVEPLDLPQAIAERLELKQFFLCRFQLEDGREKTVLTPTLPKKWLATKSRDQSIAFRGVLVGAGQAFVATHLSWFPKSGIPDGQSLLAAHGMDASLWDEIVQRSPFISPDKGREALAFYSSLIAIKAIPQSLLSQRTSEAMRQLAARTPTGTTQLEKQLASAVKEQAAKGLSSVAPMFLEPQSHVGELVRIEGTARRAIRIAVNDNFLASKQPSIREYFELEVFTEDSQNLPIVCCVPSLPAGFPTGDAIREGVRIDGVFFKSWRYRSRKVVDAPGETTTQQQSYTPVIVGAMTWLQVPPAQPNWWGLAVGGGLFAAMMIGLLRLMTSFRNDRRVRPPGETPDFSQFHE